MLEKVISIVLTHQSPDEVARMCHYWERLMPEVLVVVAYGGKIEDFDQIDRDEKFFVDDGRLRTKDHQRELQSYSGVFRAASEYLKIFNFTHLYFTEFDHVPLRQDFLVSLIHLMKNEKADVLMRNLQQINGTGSPHYLYHLGMNGFSEMLALKSDRKTPSVVLSGLGFGQLWKREVFDAVAVESEEVACYLEVWLPTIAHHLGYRVRSWDNFAEYSSVVGDRVDEMFDALRVGAWALHPVKTLWLNNSLIDEVLKVIENAD